MGKYSEIFISTFKGYASYLWGLVINPSWTNYFYWLIGISLFFFLWEIVFPWRKNQKVLRKDFFLDSFYMFFNFFIFSLLGFQAVATISAEVFKDTLAFIGLENFQFFTVESLPDWAQLLTLFILRDFIHYFVHRLLHRVEWLWQFHKVHHSVEEMGFAAHLRFHWVENIVYRTLEYIPLSLIGFGVDDFFIVYTIGTVIGHFNHSNIKLNLGILKYIFNSPQMHIWHHAHKIPNKHGVNFGLSLSIWDYLFGTDHIPKDGGSEKLGFEDMNKFPISSFWKQFVYPWFRSKE
ncbi:MAG: sterol desaturase family protein [Cytophagales bacterium]|nr:sterol desaturase family protein [Cytophagales bacterium]